MKITPVALPPSADDVAAPPPALAASTLQPAMTRLAGPLLPEQEPNLAKEVNPTASELSGWAAMAGSGVVE